MWFQARGVGLRELRGLEVKMLLLAGVSIGGAAALPAQDLVADGHLSAPGFAPGEHLIRAGEKIGPWIVDLGNV